MKAVYEKSRRPDQDIVLINDGVRPFVDQAVIGRSIACVKQYGSCVAVCPVPETIVEVDDADEIRNIPLRSRCSLSKAPQGFWLKEIMEAHGKAQKEGRFDCTNSAELMRRYGHSLHVIHDTDRNIKITTPTDLVIMRGLLDESASQV